MGVIGGHLGGHLGFPMQIINFNLTPHTRTNIFFPGITTKVSKLFLCVWGSKAACISTWEKGVSSGSGGEKAYQLVSSQGTMSAFKFRCEQSCEYFWTADQMISALGACTIYHKFYEHGKNVMLFILCMLRNLKLIIYIGNPIWPPIWPPMTPMGHVFDLGTIKFIN